MNWSDEGIVLAARPHGETAAIVDLFTHGHGRHSGLVHGGRSRRLRPVLQIGNHVDVEWKGRLAEHLGHYSVELRRGYAAETMERPSALAALASLCTLARILPERDPHPNLYEITLFVFGFLDDESVWPALYVRWELALLDELGFGLDLETCAVTGSKEELTFVSPKSGRAVSAGAAEPYRDRLLPLPAFLGKQASGVVTPEDVAAGLRLTEHFLKARAMDDHAIAWPDSRSRLAALIARSAAG